MIADLYARAMSKTRPLDVQGYSCCSHCPELHPSILLWRLGGVCPTCLDAGVRPLRLLEVEVEGRTAIVKLKHRRGGSRGCRETAKTASKAREAARRRLARLLPDLYAVLVAQERSERGLEGWYVTSDDSPIDAKGLERLVSDLLASFDVPIA